MPQFEGCREMFLSVLTCSPWQAATRRRKHTASLFLHDRLRTPLGMRQCTSLRSRTLVTPAFMSNFTCLLLQQLLWEGILEREDPVLAKLEIIVIHRASDSKELYRPLTEGDETPAGIRNAASPDSRAWGCLSQQQPASCWR